jgi:hypothetical protein
VTEEDGGNERGSGWTMAKKTPIALVLLAGIAALAWYTMEPGKFRTLVIIVLGGLALRLLLGSRFTAHSSGGG